MVGTHGWKARAYTAAEKVALVTEIDFRYRAGEGSLVAIARKLGTSDTNFHNWVRAGIKPAPQRLAPRRTYSPADRERLMSEIERLRSEGQSIDAACRAVGISVKSFRSWRTDATPAPIMRPVEITALVPVAPSATPIALAVRADPALTLLAPGGYRLEGLGVETAAALLRALA